MEKETLKNIMHFLEKEDNKSSVKWKLVNNEHLTEDELDFNDDLVLSFSNIKSLPKGLKVGGALILSDSDIKSLPEGLEVDGDLDLSYTNITSLPEGLKLFGGLLLNNSKITSLPKGFIRVWGDFNISYTEITSLPEGLEVGGLLQMSNTNITSLPKGLEVWSALYISKTPLEKFSDEELREMVKPGYIKGKIYR